MLCCGVLCCIHGVVRCTLVVCCWVGVYVVYGVDTLQIGVLVMLDCGWIRIHTMLVGCGDSVWMLCTVLGTYVIVYIVVCGGCCIWLRFMV